ncbi:MAG: hypothetical protein PT116_13330 [Aphanizomenon gracile PMC638.10]|nr:hypothetical protein [Aphanizomenon gracile PMC638.10]
MQQRFAIAFSQEFGRGDVYEGGGELLAAALRYRSISLNNRMRA